MYTKSFKALMVRKMADPSGPSPIAIAKDIGVSQSTLYRWASETDTVDVAELPEPPTFSKSMQRMSNMKRPQDWSPEEKLAAVLEAASLTDAELGAFLRNKGLHEAHLQQWREQMLSGLKPIPVRNKKSASESKRVRELEKDLRRKEKALAETAALLVLKKKAQEIWGDEDDDTDN